MSLQFYIGIFSLTVIINDGYNSGVNASVDPAVIWTDVVNIQGEGFIWLQGNQIIDYWTSEAIPHIRIWCWDRHRRCNARRDIVYQYRNEGTEL